MLLSPAQVQVISCTLTHGDPHAGLIQIFHLAEWRAVLDQIGTFDNHVRFAEGDLSFTHRFDGQECNVPLILRQSLENLPRSVIGDELDRDAQVLAQFHCQADGYSLRLARFGIALCKHRVAEVDGSFEHASRGKLFKDFCGRGEHKWSPWKLSSALRVGK
ncbi:hypothetical protein D3C73_1078090 [compost metagenome]